MSPTIDHQQGSIKQRGDRVLHERVLGPAVPQPQKYSQIQASDDASLHHYRDGNP